MPYVQQAIPVQNGASLVLRLFEPARPARAAVIIPSAMGVAQNFYRPFAQWLCSQGFLVATFDYRGIGLSRPASLRGYDIDIVDWATQDCARVIDFVKECAPAVRLCWIGHSLGGQLLGLIPNREKIDRVMTIATGSGYWRENAWRTKRFVWWLWYVAVPLATKVAGYFPGKRLRKIGDLPRGVIEQWRRWCLSREYVVSAEGDSVRAAYASVVMPMIALSFTDDEMMSAKSIRSLHALYVGASVKHRRIAPTEIGATRIGHFGFFRPEFERTLWPLAQQWLQ